MRVMPAIPIFYNIINWFRIAILVLFPSLIEVFERAYTVRATFIAHGVPSTDKKDFTTGNFNIRHVVDTVC